MLLSAAVDRDGRYHVEHEGNCIFFGNGILGKKNICRLSAAVIE